MKSKKKGSFLRTLSEVASLFKGISIPSVLIIGLCPIIGVTTTVIGALGLGIVFLVVFMLSAIIVSALKKVLPPKTKFIASVITVSGITAVSEVLLAAFLPSFFDAIGIYLSISAVIGVAMLESEHIDGKEKSSEAQIAALRCAISFAVIMFVVAVLREFLGNGSFCGLQILPAEKMMQLIGKPFGGFMILGFLLAASQAMKNRKSNKKAVAKEADSE